MPISSYGSGGVYHRGLRIVDKTFPRTHTKPKPQAHVYQGGIKETLKLGAKSLASFFGVPASYGAVPITAMFSDFGMEGEKRLDPDRAARLLGYRDKAHQDQMIKEQMKRDALRIKK